MTSKNEDAVVKYKREEAKRKRLAAEAAAAEKERLRLEKIKIQAMGKNFKGAKGGKISKNGITRMAHGGGIELRGKTRGRIT